MFMPGKVRVITTDSRENSVPLGLVIADPRFHRAVQDSSISDCFLSCIDYDDFLASPTSRVLSYWWQDKLAVDCKVRDPAGVVEEIAGEINLSFVRTPKTGWTELWVDYLNHLNDWQPFYKYCLPSMGALYLRATVLPQYFYLDWLTCEQAMMRGWMHQEISYGKLDRESVKQFLKLCAEVLVAQVGFHQPRCLNRSEIFSVEAAHLLLKLIDKRLNCAGMVNYFETLDIILAAVKINKVGLSSGGQEWRGDAWNDLVRDSLEACEQRIDELLDIICPLQLFESEAENLALLEKPEVARAIIDGASNTNFTQKADMYYASLQVVGAGCGFTILNPLADFLARHGASVPRNPDGSFQFGASDLNLNVLNKNYEILRTCWRTVGSNSGGSLPGKAVNLRMHPGRVPMGAATLGLGPVLKMSKVTPHELEKSPGQFFMCEEDSEAKTTIDGLINWRGPDMPNARAGVEVKRGANGQAQQAFLPKGTIMRKDNAKGIKNDMLKLHIDEFADFEMRHFKTWPNDTSVEMLTQCLNLRQSTEKVKGIFRQIDTDGKGVVAKLEFQKLFNQWSKGEIEKLLAAFSKMDDGSLDHNAHPLDYNEFVEWVMEGHGSSNVSKSY